MPCYHPVKAWRRREGRSESGAWPLTFKRSEGYLDKEVIVPCGQCIGCRLERSRIWAMRCMHESMCHEENSFLTLTYSENPGTLVLKDLQDFLKRLRKEIYPKKVRYFACGEYGEQYGRPHYHLILFGHDFHNDRFLFKRSGANSLYVSPLLNRLWSHGFAVIGDVSFDSCAYTARYCLKKITGEDSDLAYTDLETGEIRTKEFCTMSRRPGIGLSWFNQYRDEVLAHDGKVFLNGIFVKAPRYYERKDLDNGNEDMLRFRLQRSKDASATLDLGERSPDRLAVKEELKRITLSQLQRGYETTRSVYKPFE